MAGGSVKLGGGDLLLIGQAKLNDGPWELAEDFEGYSGLVKYSVPLGGGTFQASLNLYDASWAPTEQTPERVIGTPLCEDRYCSLDLTLRGETQRQTLDAELHLARLADHRLGAALRLEPAEQLHLLPRRSGRRRPAAAIRATVGLRRADRADSSSSTTWSRCVSAPSCAATSSTPSASITPRTARSSRPRAPSRVDESSAGLYAEAIVRPVDRLMVIGGLRGDWYRFETEALGGPEQLERHRQGRDPLAQGRRELRGHRRRGALRQLGPRASISNDARGVTNPDDPAPGLVEGHVQGTRHAHRARRSDLHRGLLVELHRQRADLRRRFRRGRAKRSRPPPRGYELTGFWKPNAWLAVDAVWTGSRAHYVGLPEGENYVPGALESSGELGVSAIFPDWNASGRLRYLGPHALIEDNSVRAASTLLFNLRAAWTPQRFGGWEVYGELLNVFDSEGQRHRLFLPDPLPWRAGGRRRGHQQPHRRATPVSRWASRRPSDTPLGGVTGRAAVLGPPGEHGAGRALSHPAPSYAARRRNDGWARAASERRVGATPRAPTFPSSVGNSRSVASQHVCRAVQQNLRGRISAVKGTVMPMT